MSPRTCCREATGWIAPGLGLALVPKCPMCVAGYVAAVTGVGVSMPVAAGLRWGFVVVCVGTLAFVAGRAAARVLKAKT
jgi:hypothetical protein